MTLYVSAPVLKKGNNEILVFELDLVENPVIRFLDYPIFE